MNLYVHGLSPTSKKWFSKGPLDPTSAKHIAEGMRRAGYKPVITSTSAKIGK